MEMTAPPADLAGVLAGTDPLPMDDRSAAEALAAAMAGWSAPELEAYRAAVLAEVSALAGKPPRGFLAVEVAALVSAESSAA